MNMTRIRIENVVASTSLGPHLDLAAIARTLEGAEYVPSEFPGLIYRLKEPRTAILLFQSGKVVCTGGKSWNQVNQSVRTISELIRKRGQKVLEHPKIEVQNIVATSNLESQINLTSVAVTLGLDRVEYEPEQFPGLICRIEKPHVVVLLFGSGKLVCTGARRPSDVELAVRQISLELQKVGLLREPRAEATPPPAATPRKPRPAVSSRATAAPTQSPAPVPSDPPTVMAN
jgi:transcription initiation factor TFIID TATA-box-binding protein